MEMMLLPSEVLKRVKKMLPKNAGDLDNASPYICDNVNRLWKKGCMTDDTKNVIRSHIDGLLDDRFCLKDWLIGNGHTSSEEFRDDYDNAWSKLQQTRQLWLDDMILHFKSKGM